MIKLKILSAVQNKKAERLASVYCGILFAVHPLILHNGYFDITETKQIVFVVLTVLWLLCSVFFLLSSRELSGKVCPEDVYAFFFVAVYIAATFLGGFAAKGWIGADNRYQGIVSFILYYLVFLIISRRKISEKVLFPMGGAFAIAMLLAAINRWGFDPLHLMENLVPFDRGRYISTIGNINFFGAYVCLILPVFWLRWCCGGDRRCQLLRFVLIVLGTFGAAASSSDCTVLGLAVAWLALPFLVKDDAEALRRWALLLSCTVGLLQLYRVLSDGFGGGGVSPILRLLLNSTVSMGMIASGLFLYICIRKREFFFADRFRKGYGILLLVGLLVLLILLVLMNTLFSQLDLGIVSEFMVFDLDWGTDRGRVWSTCLERWIGMPWWQKILGGGSGCLARMDALNPVFPDAILDAAHCEFLHYLLTHGILGLGLYLGLNGLLLYRCIQSGTGLAMSLGLGMIGYLAQSTVNIAQPMTTPLFFVLLAMLAGQLRETEPANI